ncbi:MAG: Tad domain-containing protein [marine benthic group bacterium]|nr:Tad domain-containing protein [Gemmatimonadota bacterium]
MFKWGNGSARNERGATLVLVAGSMVALLGVAALAIDVGFLLDARTQAQRTADAMALAAASAFIDDMPNAETLAPIRATEYASRNPVNGVTASFVPDTDMQIWLDEKKVRVTANFLRERGNPMPTFFAKVLGIDDVNVNAIATAVAAPADVVGCLAPWALPDAWEDDLTGGAPEEFDYDDADKSKTPTSGDSFDNYCPCTRDESTGDIVVDTSYEHIGLVCQDQTSCTGYGSEFRNGDGSGHVNDVGRQLTLKPGNPNQAWSPGWFFAWRPTDDTGGNDYRTNIITCIDEQVFDTGTEVPFFLEPGNMIGPTAQGVSDRINGDPHYWQDGCRDGTSCIRGPGDCGGPGNDNQCSGYDERIVTVPLMDPTEVMRSGMTSIRFRGFMRLFLDDPSGNDVTAHILGLGGAAGSGDTTEDTGAIPLYLRLVEND